MPTLKLCLLGAPQIEYSGQPVPLVSQKAMALLFYLALESHTPPSRGKLAAMFWEESDERHARRSLNDVLYKLRQALPASAQLTTTWECIQFAKNNNYWVDVEEFQHGLRAISSTPDAISVSRAARAADLYRGEFLDGFVLKDSEAFCLWAQFRRETLHRAHISLLEHLTRYYQEHSDYEQAIKYSLDALQADSLHESTYRTLMRLYHLTGNRTAALSMYENCRQTLDFELGAAPSDETQELYALVSDRSTPREEELPSWQLPSLHREEHLPLVDRDSELTLLHASLSAALRGQAGVVLVEGEAGIGKTRLIEEFLARQTASRIAPLTSRCQPTQAPLPYQAFIPILQAILSLQEELSTSGQAPRWQKLRDTLASWNGFAKGGQPGEIERSQSHLAPHLVAILRNIAQRRPAVIFLDDYQWADTASRDLLGYLVHSLVDGRVLFIIAYRPEELSPSAEASLHHLGMQCRAKHLILSPLDAEQTGQLSTFITRGIGGRVLATRIYRQSEGNPLFAIALSRSLFRPQPIATPQERIPSNIRSLIRTRLHRLDPVTREFLATAAVSGDQCDFATVQRAAGLDQSRALRALDTLLQMRLLTETTTGEFRFAYGSIRQLTLEELSSTHVRELRLRVAKVRPDSYRKRLTQASSRLAEQLRLYRRQRQLLAHGFRSLLRLIGAIIFVSLVAFTALRILPSGPFDPPERLPTATMDALRNYYPLDRPPAEQYWIYLRHVLPDLDLGPSYLAPEHTVNDILRQCLPASVRLGLIAALFAMGFGVPLGVAAARRPGSLCDNLCMGTATFGLALPVIVLGPLLLWTFSLTTGWLPPAGWGEPSHLVLPTVATGLGCGALIAQVVRDSVMKVQRGGFVLITRPQNRHRRTLVLRRALRLSLLSLLLLARSMATAVLAGSLVIEQLFDIPGMGRYLVTAIQSKDYPVLVNTLLLCALLLATVDVLADAAHTLLKLGLPQAED